MQPEEKPKKRPASDAIHITFAVPVCYLYEEPTGDDDEVNKETRHQFHRTMGWKDDTLKDLLTEDYLKEMGIEGSFDIVYKPDAWGHKSRIIDHRFTLESVKEYYKDNAGESILILRPRIPIWYQCIQLTEQEIDAMKKVVERVYQRRVDKRQKFNQ